MVSNLSQFPYVLPQAPAIRGRLLEPRRFIQVVAGPRQVGKTTLVREVVGGLERPVHWASADDPGLRDRAWLDAQWQAARLLARSGPAILVLDEIQKLPAWSETVKRLWDEDTADGRDVRVVLLGSAPLVVQRGMSDSLAGRFEVTRLAQWGLGEMGAAFGWDLETYLAFGGYPGAAPLIGDRDRWRAYLLDSLIETTLSRDILLLTRVDKPALLRQLFRLGCDYSGQVVSFTKLVGQLQDAGNTTTLAHYLELLRGSGLLAGLEKYAGSRLRQRGSSPKLLALDPGLLAAMSDISPEDLARDRERRGRVVESAVGAHLVHGAGPSISVTWWRDRDREVDFVLSDGSRVLAIEVASGRRKTSLPGLEAFRTVVPYARTLLIGGQGLSLEVALTTSPTDLLAG
jgi:predicted AAA+ superfamily ATPase